MSKLKLYNLIYMKNPERVVSETESKLPALWPGEKCWKWLLLSHSRELFVVFEMFQNKIVLTVTQLHKFIKVIYNMHIHDISYTTKFCPWNFPGKSTGVGCHFLLQGIFPTQGSSPGLSHCRQMLYHLSHQGCPIPQ